MIGHADVDDDVDDCAVMMMNTEGWEEVAEMEGGRTNRVLPCVPVLGDVIIISSEHRRNWPKK